jgi:uncharacterized protein
VHVSRIGLTPLKGARHQELTAVDLTLDGPVGDRVFCLVDRSRSQVLRTVQHPALLQTLAQWEAGVLNTTLPAGTVAAVPAPSGHTVEVDYWGRPAVLEVVDGPLATAYSEHLGREVELARAAPGEVVYGAPVSLVTSASLDRLSEEVGAPVDAASFRATFVVHTDAEPHAEDQWVGSTLRVGGAEVRVRTGIPRCALVDRHPLTGERHTDALRCLGRYRRALAEVVFGVDAVVTRPGRVRVGDELEGR